LFSATAEKLSIGSLRLHEKSNVLWFLHVLTLGRILSKEEAPSKLSTVPSERQSMAAFSTDLRGVRPCRIFPGELALCIAIQGPVCM
jgi:hypothetical protein